MILTGIADQYGAIAALMPDRMKQQMSIPNPKTAKIIPQMPDALEIFFLTLDPMVNVKLQRKSEEVFFD